MQLGICSYSFGKSQLADALPALKDARVRYINIKPEFHLPYDSSPAQIAEVKKLLDDNGIILAGTGTTYLTKEDMGEDPDSASSSGKALGSPLIVIGPTVETLPLIEKCVKEYDIKVAVHNHGPSDKHFPTPQSALAAIKGMDPRVGLCMDIGHTMRTGTSPVDAAKLAGARMLDLHTKDVRMVDGKWVSADCGDGDIDLPGLFRQLKETPGLSRAPAIWSMRSPAPPGISASSAPWPTSEVSPPPCKPSNAGKTDFGLSPFIWGRPSSYVWPVHRPDFGAPGGRRRPGRGPCLTNQADACYSEAVPRLLPAVRYMRLPTLFGIFSLGLAVWGGLLLAQRPFKEYPAIEYTDFPLPSRLHR